MLFLNDGMFEPVVALAKQEKGKFSIANIVPKTMGHIPILEYNVIARRFAKELRRFIRDVRIPMAVSLSAEDIGL